jgi:hypothetical protein
MILPNFVSFLPAIAVAALTYGTIHHLKSSEPRLNSVFLHGGKQPGSSQISSAQEASNLRGIRCRWPNGHGLLARVQGHWATLQHDHIHEREGFAEWMEE